MCSIPEVFGFCGAFSGDSVEVEINEGRIARRQPTHAPTRHDSAPIQSCSHARVKHAPSLSQSDSLWLLKADLQVA